MARQIIRTVSQTLVLPSITVIRPFIRILDKLKCLISTVNYHANRIQRYPVQLFFYLIVRDEVKVTPGKAAANLSENARMYDLHPSVHSSHKRMPPNCFIAKGQLGAA